MGIQHTCDTCCKPVPICIKHKGAQKSHGEWPLWTGPEFGKSLLDTYSILVFTYKYSETSRGDVTKYALQPRSHSQPVSQFTPSSWCAHGWNITPKPGSWEQGCPQLFHIPFINDRTLACFFDYPDGANGEYNDDNEPGKCGRSKGTIVIWLTFNGVFYFNFMPTEWTSL